MAEPLVQEGKKTRGFVLTELALAAENTQITEIKGLRTDSTVPNKAAQLPGFKGRFQRADGDDACDGSCSWGYSRRPVQWCVTPEMRGNSSPFHKEGSTPTS